MTSNNAGLTGDVDFFQVAKAFRGSPLTTLEFFAFASTVAWAMKAKIAGKSAAFDAVANFAKVEAGLCPPGNAR